MIGVITVDFLDYFSDITRSEKDDIRQHFTTHGQRAGAEYLLDRLEGSGTHWPRHLLMALEALKLYDHVRYLYEKYKECLRRDGEGNFAEEEDETGK